ncbi:hypothetical protein BC826DRAFT_920462 [Russula brevipes]|nr:hypothetical protein BC826DRAFT_920462 [Russula brevipes]
MHERNPYKTPPDFETLAQGYPPLRPHIIHAVENAPPTIDFHDETAQRRLTQALLYRDFDIKLEIPRDRLCPPVPNRLNYILWLQDIVSHTSSSDLLSPVRGIDIGTGASAIYPLIACRLSPNWHFVATDIDEEALISAQANIDRNGLSERITLLRADPTGPIMLPLIQSPAASFDFSMCNPPFYSSTEDATQSAAVKELLPNAVCTGAEVEMITPGGEEAFVSKMLSESITLGQRCRHVPWYTSMFGKQSSLTALVTLLRTHSITNYAITELVQGHTRRWALAWSFIDTRLPDVIARPSAPALRRLLPPRTTHRQPLCSAPPIATIQRVLSSLIGEAVSISAAPGNKVCVVAKKDTWSRSARRKGRTSNPDSLAGRKGRESREDDGSQRHRGENQVELVVQWKHGHDLKAFESFACHVGRKMCDAVEAEAEVITSLSVNTH